MTASSAEAGSRPRPTKQVPCRVCGVMMTVGARVRRPKRCIECACRAANDAARQIRNRSGPVYEKMMAAHALNPGGRPRRGGVSRETPPPADATP